MAALLVWFLEGCGLVKNLQNPSHALVNEQERNTEIRSNTSLQATTANRKTSKDVKSLKTKNPDKSSVYQANDKIQNKQEVVKPIIAEKNTEKEEKGRRVIKAEGLAAEVITEAEQFLGTPYRIGGTTKQGIDCSGLVMVAFQKKGIQLPRISQDQYNFGKPVKKDDILPGDLLFFSTPSRPNQIGHSALCVTIEDGVVKFIHAASTGVRYDYLVPGYYLTHYKGACRIFDKHLSKQ